MSKKREVIIILSKIFRYPLAMLDKNAPLQDAVNKMTEDLNTDLIHQLETNPSELRQKYFETEVYKEMPFHLEKPGNVRHPTFSVSYKHLLNTLVTIDAERKYGKFDHEINPTIYNAVEKRDGFGKVFTKYYIKEEINDALYNIRDFWESVLSTCEQTK